MGPWQLRQICQEHLLEIRSKVNAGKQYHSIENICSYIYGSARFPYLSPFTRYSQLKCKWPWTLKWSQVKYKYVNRKPIHDFLYHGNSNLCLNCHQKSKIKMSMTLTLEWNNVKYKYANHRFSICCFFHLSTFVAYSQSKCPWSCLDLLNKLKSNVNMPLKIPDRWGWCCSICHH